RPSDGLEAARALGEITSIAPDAPPPSSSRPGVTSLEQRTVSVAFAKPPSTLDAASIDAVRALAAPFGAELATRDDSIVVTLSGHAVATDQARKAARCALALRAHLEGTPLALVTGSALAAGRIGVTKLVARAENLLDCHAPHAVRIDEVTAALLDASFDV